MNGKDRDPVLIAIVIGIIANYRRDRGARRDLD